jgi:hypothetical protein
MPVHTVELNDEAWAAERDAIAQRFLGIDAATFVAKFSNGDYNDVDLDGLMTVLAFFPELD